MSHELTKLLEIQEQRIRENLNVRNRFIPISPDANKGFVREDRTQYEGGLERAVYMHDSILVTGDPGSGKSTQLLNWLRTSLRWLVERNIVPLYLPLFTAVNQLSTQTPLEEYLSVQFQEHGLDKSFFNRLLSSHSLLTVFDGFDEIGLVGEPQMAEKAITSFPERYDCKAVVASRDAAILGGMFKGFERFGIPELQDDEVASFVRSFIQRRYTGYYDSSSTIIDRNVKSFLNRMSAVPILMRNPSFLRLAVHSAHMSSGIHDSVYHIYRDAIESSVGQLPQTIAPTIRSEMGINQIKNFIVNLGYIYHTAGRREMGPVAIENALCSVFLFKENIDFFQKAGNRVGVENLERSLITYKKELLEAAVAANILYESSPNAYAFCHLGLQEFCTVEKLGGLMYKDGAIPILTEHICEPWWQNVFLLATVHEEQMFMTSRERLYTLALDRNPDLAKKCWNAASGTSRDHVYGVQESTAKRLNDLCAE